MQTQCLLGKAGQEKAAQGFSLPTLYDDQAPVDIVVRLGPHDSRALHAQVIKHAETMQWQFAIDNVRVDAP